MRINLTEYRPASTSVLGPIGGSTVVPAESATGQTLNDIKNQRDQQIMDMITGGLDATALVLEANKKIKAGEDEVTMLKVEEEADKMGLNVYKQGYDNEDITVSGDTTDYTYEKDKTLGTYRHQDFTHSSENLRQAITDNIVFKLRESGTEIDEKLQLKIEKRIDMKLDPHFGKLEQLVIKRSSEAIDTAIQNEADRLMSTVRQDNRDRTNIVGKELSVSEKFEVQMGSFVNHIKEQVNNDVITPEHGDRWIEKVSKEYSYGVAESFLISGKKEHLKLFENLTKEENDVWPRIDNLKKIKLLGEYAQKTDSLDQQKMLTTALTTISDTNNDYAGAGGHLLLDELLGPKNWSLNKDTGKVNIKTKVADPNGDFAKIKDSNFRVILKSATSRLETDWKNSTKLLPEDRALLNSQFDTYEKDVLNNYSNGYGGYLNNGFDLQANDKQIPFNFMGSDFYAGKNVEKVVPNLNSSIEKLNTILSGHTKDINNFLEFNQDRLSHTQNMLHWEDEVSKIKNPRVRSIGERYLNNIKRKLSKRIVIMSETNKNNTNFFDLHIKTYSETGGFIPKSSPLFKPAYLEAKKAFAEYHGVDLGNEEEAKNFAKRYPTNASYIEKGKK